jgi:hypothetical protein
METIYHEYTFVCFLDILGFKDLVTNNSPKDLTKLYKILLQESVDEGINYWKRKDVANFKDKSEINSIVISDSIIIWTSDIGPTSFLKLVMTVQGILFKTMHQGIPLRGGISAGPLTILKSKNNTTVFGIGLVNAYTLESQQDWSGCVIDDECIKIFKKLLRPKKSKKKSKVKKFTIKDLHFLLKYPAPMKSGKVIDRWVFDWTKLISPDKGGFTGVYIKPENVVDSFGFHEKNVDDWRVQTLIRNTIQFWNDMMDSPSIKLGPDAVPMTKKK